MELPTLPPSRRASYRHLPGFRFPAAVALALTCWGLAAEAVEPNPDEAVARDRYPELKRLSPTDEIWLDVNRKEVVVGGAVALAKGEIEVFACPKLSKEHEAILATRCPARLVHAGLLAIGLEPGRPVSFDPEYAPARGPKVTVRVRRTSR